MSANEQTSLLGHSKQRSGSHTHHQIPNNLGAASPRRASPVPPHEAPSTIQSFKNLLFGSWINVLLIAVPFSFISHFAKWGSTPDFIISFIAIIPLANLLAESTDACASSLGETLGGLLNATFGNVIELLIGIFALLKGELRIVQTSLLGSVLSNLLLVLGCAFMAAGVNSKESTFQSVAASASTSIMMLATAALSLPVAYHAANAGGAAALGSTKDIDNNILVISRGTAILLLLMYCGYLVFQLKTHAYLFEATNDTGSVEDGDHKEEEATMNVRAAVASLLAVTVVTSFCADYLVAAIDDFAQRFHIPKAFIGVILLPIVGNACEHFSAVLMAMRNRMEVTLGVAVGSSIQIAVGLIPVLVILGWIVGQPLSLYFGVFETLSLFLATLMVTLVAVDGRSNIMEGSFLVCLYLIIAICFWVS